MRVTAAYVTARRGAQRLRYGERRRVAVAITYVTRHGSQTAHSGYDTRYGGIDDQSVETNNPGISLYFELCERRNSECTRVFKVPVFAKVMPGLQLSLYARERLCALMSEDSTVKHAMTELGKEGIWPCRQTVWRFWVHYRRNKTTKPLPRSGRSTKLTERVHEQKMQSDDETTVKELALLIRSEFGYWISLRTVLKGRKLLGWTSRGAAYCQLIRQQNKDSGYAMSQ